MSAPREFSPDTHAGRIAIYVRVSTEDQCKDEDNSLDNQRHRCSQYLRSLGATDHSIEPLRLYREEGRSGKDTHRPELQRLVRDIRKGLIDVLLFTELSRVSRSLRDFLVLHDYFEEKGVKWISLKERFDTTSPHGWLVTMILMALAQFERETTSLRTRLAMRDRAERGLHNGGNIPYGYVIDPDRKGRLVITEEEAEGVREAFALYLQAGSIAETARLLDERGYRRSARVSRRGRKWKRSPLSFNVVNYILRNPTYVGFKEVNRKKRDVPEEEALALDERDRYRLVPAVWEPIIDVETFEAAQALLRENRKRTANVLAETQQHDYVLTGIVACGHCGRGLEGAAGKGQRYHYYQHATGTKRDDCGRRGHRVELVEGAVLERLALLADDEDLLDRIVAKANERIEDGVPAKHRAVETAKRKVEKLEADEERLTEHLLAAEPGQVPEMFWRKAKDLEQAKNAARGEVVRLTSEWNELKAARLNAADYRAALRKFTEVYEHLDALQKADLLAYLLDRVDVRVVMKSKKQVATEITISLLGEVPDIARYEAGADGQFHQPPKWLRQQDSNLRQGG